MPIYEYLALNSTGKKIKGTVDAESSRQARSKLKKDGVYPTSLKEASHHSSFSSTDVTKYFQSNKITQKELSITTRQMSTLINAGLPLVSTLTACAEQTENEVARRILVAVKEDVEEGSSLSESMGKFPKAFPKLYLSMIASGEASGTLDKVLINLADHLEAQVQLMGKVKSSLMYPITMLVICFFVIMGLFIFVVPKIVAIFTKQGAVLPMPTKVTMAISNFLVGYWWLIILLIIAAFILIPMYYSQEKGRSNVDRILLNLPIYSKIYQKIYTSRVSLTLGTLLNSGVQLLTAMDICKRIVGNVHVVKALDEARERVREGSSLAEELKQTKLFPSLLTHMIAVGEKSGDLEGMLSKAGTAYKNEADATLTGLTQVLELLMIVVVGSIVLWVVMSVMLPMVDMISLVQK